MSYLKNKPTAEMNELLVRTGDSDYRVAHAAQRQLAKALELPLRRGVMKGDNLQGIYENVYFQPGSAIEFPLDFLTPTNVNEFVAYTIPYIGQLPERSVEGDYVAVPTYPIGATIDWPLRYSTNARWDVLARVMTVMEGQFIRKRNDDGWHVILAAAAGRNLTVYDSQAVAGLFTKRLVALMKTVMRRNSGGGNYTSVGQGKFTDMWMSPEGAEDIRSWDVTQIDEVTRREIWQAGEGEESLMRIFGVNLHILDELGVGQIYQNYLVNTLGASLPTDKLEFVVGLDLFNRDSFLRPIREDLQIFENVLLHQQRRAGLYGWEEAGYTSLVSWRSLLGAF